ncbi:DUF4913 domain-containing protein (plasmid) [Nocardia sp. NBC_01377]|uniref:DUF4913 domain-containing protein n=1 Tax=Nocardia sp. NBC_01377 TaxID=2903595 RepID=UPI002F914B81
MSDTTTETSEATEAVAAPVIPEMDLGSLLNTAVRKAVVGQVSTEAKTIAAGVIAAMLTPEVIAGMRETAILEAERALNPPPEIEVEAEPEAEEEEKAEEEPELFYRDVGEFVDKQIANLYRREVGPSTEGQRRWCPRWWDHGEAYGRLEDLWRAWEKARQGEGDEMATWWITHCDPMMDRLLDPDGVFSACSVGHGHHYQTPVPRLALVEAPEGFFADGYTPAEPAPLSSSTLVIPRPSVGRSRVVKAFGQ